MKIIPIVVGVTTIIITVICAYGMYIDEERQTWEKIMYIPFFALPILIGLALIKIGVC